VTRLGSDQANRPQGKTAANAGLLLVSTEGFSDLEGVTERAAHHVSRPKSGGPRVAAQSNRWSRSCRQGAVRRSLKELSGHKSGVGAGGCW
jgi:hypothetical protein